jgi:hypothetical protein
VKVTEQIRTLARQKFGGYNEALERVQRAEVGLAAAQAELKAARDGLSQYGTQPTSLRFILEELKDIFGEDA